MNTENLARHNRGYWKTVEGVNKGFPYLDVAAAFAFIIKAIHYWRMKLSAGYYFVIFQDKN